KEPSDQSDLRGDVLSGSPFVPETVLTERVRKLLLPVVVRGQCRRQSEDTRNADHTTLLRARRLQALHVGARQPLVSPGKRAPFPRTGSTPVSCVREAHPASGG